jgi:hypothetical protein
MSSLPSRTLLWLPAIFALAPAGCTTPAVEGKSPLAPAQMSPDSCVLEVFFVRFPLGDPEANGELWKEVDEQHFPVELRRRLARNGFRVGLLDGQIPAVLSRLLKMKDDARPPGLVGGMRGCHTPPLAARQVDLVRWHLETRAGQPKMIVASRVYDRLPVLISEPDQLGGQTYLQAQAVLAAKTFPQGDGRVRVELVPELYHGEPRQRWVGDQGMWRLEAGKERKAFQQMAFSATLSPGCMLLVTTLPNRPGSLGYHFFTEDGGKAEQKLLVVRLAQTQHDGLFSPTRTLGPKE